MIEILLEHNNPMAQAMDWQGLLTRAEAMILPVLSIGDLTPEYTVLICDDAAIQTLNRDFRGKDKPTNVLSFPEFEAFQVPDTGHHFIGDIAMSFDTLQREADAAGIPLSDHATHLFIHSVLHLFGYDHQNEAEAEEMEAREVLILQKLGIKNPYTIETEI